MPRFDQPIEPMTLGNMRELGVGSEREDKVLTRYRPQTVLKALLHRKQSLSRSPGAGDAATVALRCPHCGRTGSGTVSEDDSDGQIEPHPRVDGLSAFVVVELRPGPGEIFVAASE